MGAFDQFSGVLGKALSDESINAIEADILMGSSLDDNAAFSEKDRLNKEKDHALDNVPIMAHPPNRSSRLSLHSFLSLALKPSFKHIKLDIKELQAASPTLACVLAQIENNGQGSEDSHETTTVFLNADIFPGPGCRNSSSCVDAEPFIEACKTFRDQVELSNNRTMSLALSLGFKVSYQSKQGYTEEDCEKMVSLVRKFRLKDRFGLVLALNARLLCLSPRVFDTFLIEFKGSQILAWTGTGEPPIARTLVDNLFDDFQRNLPGGRIGFDCSYE